MEKIDKIQKAIELGYTCDPEKGIIYGKKGKQLRYSKKNGYGMFSIDVDCKKYRIASHQFIFYWQYKVVVDCIDHINRDKLDNRIENLREVSRQHNSWNTTPKGYTWHKGRWYARIRIDGKLKHLGCFYTEAEAADAYQQAKKTYHTIP